MRKEQSSKGSFGAKALKKFKSAYIPSHEDTKKEILRKIILIICFIVFVVSCIILINQLVKSSGAKNLNNKLQDLYSTSDSSQPDSDDGKKEIAKKFTELYNRNNEIVGWLEIDGTSISYPVLQTNNNDFYLSHDFDKKESKTGAVFADFRYNVLSDKPADNTVIYGHNTLDGTFFGALHDYKKLDFIKAHPTIKFNTLYNDAEYKIVSCFLINTIESQDDKPLFDYHNRILFSNESQFNYFRDEIESRSYYKTGVDLRYGDELITLSTCSHEFYEGRFVIVARKLRNGESNKVDTDAIVENEDRYMPLVWYDVVSKKRPR